MNSQNNRVWSRGRKRDVDPWCLLVQWAKFSPHVMVSAGVCFGGKGRLHFVPEKVKVNADFCVNDLLPKLIEDCESLLPNNFIFQQDGAPAHSSRLAQEWIEQHSPEFVKKDEWPPTHLTSIPLTTTSGALCLSGTKCSLQSQPIRLNSRLCWRQSGKTYHKRLSTWLS